MLEFRITGDDAYQLCDQMAQLACILDIATHPWEHNKKEETKDRGTAEYRFDEKGMTYTTKRPDGEIESQVVIPGILAPNEVVEPFIQKTEKPAETSPAPAEPAASMSIEDLQAKARDLDTKFGAGTFRDQIKSKAGFTSMKALSPEGRVKVAAMIDEWVASHA